MYSLQNDYDTGAHPNILEKLITTNSESQIGYGLDDYTREAKNILRKKLENPNAEIFFLSGGTQTNLITISFLLKPYEAVICATSGHIFANECGAIEATGHKVIAIDSEFGKLTTKNIDKALSDHNFKPHIVKPKLVYISNSTEIGTIYTKVELSNLYNYCKSKDLLLYLDGARVGHALAAKNNNLSLADISKLTHVFYIGATKNGGLLGEALIFNTQKMGENFDYVLKQKGALLAKGRVLAIQFIELFKDNLYFDLAEHANKMALKIIEKLSLINIEFYTNSTTNLVFPILPNNVITQLKEKYLFHVWKQIDNKTTAIRLVTSWSTNEKMINEFVKDIKSLQNTNDNKKALT